MHRRHPGPPARAMLWVAAAMVVVLSGGCPSLLPENIDANPQPERQLVKATDQAALYDEAGAAPARWLEAERGDEPGRVGGYLSDPPAPRLALVLLLGGASSFDPGGPLGVTLFTHQYYEAQFSSRGFRIWTLVRRECGTPYGAGDVRDVVQALDWLEREGKAWLGVERVYVFGFSTGGTQAILADRQRDITAVVAMGGLTRPNQFYDFHTLYELIGALFPRNTGICQLQTTLDVYGPAGSDGWQTLNTVGHVEELRNPTFFIQGGIDVVYSPENLLRLRSRYEMLVAEGATLAPLEFLFLPKLNHFEPARSPEIMGQAISFFERFEPASE